MKQHDTTTSTLPREAVIYAYAHTETWLEAYAKSHQLSADELTQRVAVALLGAQGGALLGTLDSMPTLRGKTAARNTPARKVAVAKRPYRKAQVTRAPRTRRRIPCKTCGAKILNTQMGNHQRYAHPKIAPIAA